MQIYNPFASATPMAQPTAVDSEEPSTIIPDTTNFNAGQLQEMNSVSEIPQQQLSQGAPPENVENPYQGYSQSTVDMLQCLPEVNDECATSLPTFSESTAKS